MRSLKRVLAASALAVPLVIGCAGLASAAEGLDANYSAGQFVVNKDGAGVLGTNSVLNSDGVQHAEMLIWADNEGISGAFTGAGATYQQG
ncbi:hypothetical protein [Kitasatospora brasiliensis]|uniref:hypothetical protein n=1 Tax=Kitasatospora brasiliensis TaxID=3058040 RepID=UPI002931E527|nr:hypothetical protein [Kitasatospora sp. K002]